MATTLPPPQVEIEEELRPHNGNGGGIRGLAPAGGDLRAVKDPRGEPTRTGIWVGLSAIAMMFAALTSALYVREGSANTDWHHIVLPPILWFNTLALIASSVALEVARRRVAGFMRGQDSSRSSATLWLNLTMLLGLVFVVGQYLGVAQVALARAVSSHESQQFLLLCIHGSACDSRPGWLGRADPRHGEVSQHGEPVASEHDRCHVLLLAFHGDAVGVLVVRFVGEAVGRSTARPEAAPFQNISTEAL